MKRVAAIDIGTNTALLLIAEIRNQDEIYPLVQQERIVRLGEGVDKTKCLKKEAIARTLMAVKEYLKVVADYDTTNVVISGTSAVRDAQNRDFFVNRFRDEFGLEFQILTGVEEAQLTYLGALSNKTDLDGEIFLIDIGGGSTECILGTQNSIQNTISLDIGSVRLTERFAKNDPVTNDEFNLIRECVKEQLIKISDNWHFKPGHFVGVAGTVTTLAAMNLKLTQYNPEIVDNSILSNQQIADIVDNLKSQTLSERKLLPGLKPERADIILSGAIILLEFMKQFNFQKVIVSDRGLRFGLLFKFLGTTG